MSQSTQDIEQNDDSYDESNLENIRQQVCLTNHQLLELTYNDQKFYDKLKQLNANGTESINQLKFHEALIYLNEAEKVLEYAASCGKTIERNLIITTLNNEAALYQRACQYEKASSYIQAIIYNISSFFEKDQPVEFTQKILNQNSSEYEDFRIYLWRKKSLALYHLQFCAVNSQNKNHENALNSATKAISLLKQVCMDFHRYEQYIHRKGSKLKTNLHDKRYPFMLYELANMKQLNIEQVEFEALFNKTVKYIAIYLKNFQKQQEDEQNNAEIKQKFSTYSIGHLMQIVPIQLHDHQNEKLSLNLKNELSMKQKYFKAIYISIGHFIVATELRFISTEKYTLDQSERKSSIQYKQSQYYHLHSIILASKYLPCQSVYFQHIINSFRNHYKIDILQQGKRYLQDNDHVSYQDLIDEFDTLPQKSPNQRQKIISSKSSQQNSSGNQNRIQIRQNPTQIQRIQSNHSVENVQFKLDTEQSQQIKVQEERLTGARTTTKQSRQKMHQGQQKKGTAKKNLLRKSQVKLQIQNTQSSTKPSSKPQIIQTMTSRQKQNKLKVVKSQSKNKISSVHESSKKIVFSKKVTDKHPQSKAQRKDASGLATLKSRSKSKRVATNTDTDRKPKRRDDEPRGRLAEEEYGVGRKTGELKASREVMRKSKLRRESDDRTNRLGSPELKIRKLKSPRNPKKNQI